MSWRASLMAVALTAAIVPTLSYAQNQDNGGGRRQRNNDNGGGGQRGGDWQQRRLEQAKERLGASDEEWKVIEPKLMKVMQAQQQAMSGMFGGRGMGRPGGGGGGGGGNDQAPTTKLGQAAADLRKATEDDASPEDVEKKLAAYRAARTEAQAGLETARKDLKEVLTPKQEALMVLGNVLE